MNENLRSGELAKVKKRHGCFTAWLVFMSIIYFVAGIFLFTQGDYSSLPGWYIPVQIVGILSSLAAVIALFKWKKWGFWLFCGAQLVAFVVNLSIGVGIGRSLYGLLSIPILYGVLNIGKENKGWTQLE